MHSTTVPRQPGAGPVLARALEPAPTRVGRVPGYQGDLQAEVLGASQTFLCLWGETQLINSFPLQEVPLVLAGSRQHILHCTHGFGAFGEVQLVLEAQSWAEVFFHSYF